MAEVKLKEETELWEPRGPCGSWGPAEDTHSDAVEPAHLKEEEPELCIKQEPQEFPLHMVSVKSEEDEDKSSVLHQRATEENREETNVTEAGCSSDPLTQFHSDSEEHTDSSEDTEHSEDYSQQQAHSKRSYAMVPPGAAVRDKRPYSCSKCGKSFTMKSKLNIHMLVHSEDFGEVNRSNTCGTSSTSDASHDLGNWPTRCSVCKKDFSRKSSLTQHLQDRHHMCLVCKECFPDSVKLNEHLRSHVEDGSVDRSVLKACSFCGKEFTNNTALRRHVQVHTGEKPFHCAVCEKDFKQNCDLKRHMRIHTGERTHKCSVCERTFPDSIKLKEHLRTHVEDGTVDQSILKACSECGKEFTNNFALRRHMQVHTREKPFHCSVCGKDFKQNSDLKRHVKTHTGEKPHVCSVCGKGFAVKADLTLHQKCVHLICPVCGEHFPNNIKLNEHLKGYVEDGTVNQSFIKRYMKPHKCSQCGKEFRKKSYLQTHMFVHTGEKPFKCTLCDKSFTFKFEVNQHLRFVHHVCPVCREDFLRDSDLNEHLKTHVEDGTVDPSFLDREIGKQCSCSLCGKEFYYKSALQMHMLVHSGEKPFKCSVCDKTFAQKGNLKIHQRSHTGERPFVCSVCDKGFITSAHLKKHVTRNHDKSDSAHQTME
ncbi:uncharacterized protein [Eucyclogobius newberryi]|uniref:uncharacterized protein n=1 Tax=Eucyclogobius newberryi TaxID=166745 RepID=UPI003B58B6F4